MVGDLLVPERHSGEDALAPVLTVKPNQKGHGRIRLPRCGPVARRSVRGVGEAEGQAVTHPLIDSEANSIPMSVHSAAVRRAQVPNRDKPSGLRWFVERYGMSCQVWQLRKGLRIVGAVGSIGPEWMARVPIGPRYQRRWRVIKTGTLADCAHSLTRSLLRRRGRGPSHARRT